MKFEMTPRRRMDLAFWLGTIQATLTMTVLHSWQSDDPFSTVVSIVLLMVWLAIGVFYIRNSIAFSKETLWMTIKNPAKVTIEDGALKQHHVRPNGPPPAGSRPKPPPKPPTSQIKRTFNPGSEWPPAGH